LSVHIESFPESPQIQWITSDSRESRSPRTDTQTQRECSKRAEAEPQGAPANDFYNDNIPFALQRPASIVGLRVRLDRACDRRHPCCDRHGIVVADKGPPTKSPRTNRNAAGADPRAIRLALCRDSQGRASGRLGAALDVLLGGEL
jgi:hypothetical protein